MTIHELRRQRVRYLVEHGECYPGDRPITTPLMVKLVTVLVVLELTDIVIHLLH